MNGVDILVKVNTGTAEAPNYTPVAGQRGATLNRSADTIDKTSKDSSGWNENIVSFKNWSVDCDGLLPSSDLAYTALETAYMNSAQVLIQVALPGTPVKKYQGLASITDFPIDAPYDDVATYSVSFTGSGALTIVTT